jgi:carboxymethylenebutenolidase
MSSGDSAASGGLRSVSTQRVLIDGFEGEQVEAYVGHPAGGCPRAGVVVIHDLFGYDAATLHSAVRFAWLGYDAVCPNLFWRESSGAGPREASDIARLNGGVPDGRMIADVAGAQGYLTSLSTSNGRVGIVGFGAGAREAVLAACHLDFDAAVDCYGEFVVGTAPTGKFPFQTTSIARELPKLSALLLGLFGEEDVNPSPEHVAELGEILDEEGKTHQFHSYRRAGHRFMSAMTRRTAFRPPTMRGSASTRSSATTSEPINGPLKA